MKELSIRYMELFRTSLDTIHTYGTHVNMSISFQRSAETVLKPRSARRPRSSHRPIHWKLRIYTCGSRRARNGQRSNEANTIPQSHKRNRGRSLPKLRCSQRAARTSKSPIPCINARSEGLLDHSRQHSDGGHHAKALTMLLHTTNHLQPLLSCSHPPKLPPRVRFESHDQCE